MWWWKMKMRQYKDRETDACLKVRAWEKDVWFDIWKENKPISVTVGLNKRQVKSLIKFLEKWAKE